MATTVTKSIGTNSRDYSTISGWEADTDNDLVTADEVQVGECYADSEFDERPTIAGATTDSTRFRLLKAANGEEHTGVAGTGVIIDWTTGSGNQGLKNLLNVNEAFARVEHLEVTHTNTFSDDTSSSQLKMVKVGHADAEVHRLLVYEVRCADFSQPVGIECNPGLASNCIVWDATSNTGYNNDFGAIITRNGGQAYNCTVHDWNNGGSDAAKGFFIRSGSDVVKNCYAGGTEKDFELDGSISPTLENNASSDSTADDNGGTGHLVNKSPSNQFVDVSGTPPNRDYHLQASADLVDAGQDLGDVRAAIDIDTGNRHDQGVTWDIGADEEGVEGVTPVSNDQQSPQEALQGLAETRESSQEAIGTAKQSQESAQESLQPLTATVQSAFEALDSLAQSQQSAQEARQGLSKDQVSAQEAVGVAKAALTAVYEALGPASAAAQAVHEALQGLSQDRTSVQEAGEFLGAAQESVQEAIRLGLTADSVLLYADAADGLEPAFGGDWQYARDSVAYFLDGRGLFKRMVAHTYSLIPVEVDGQPWLAARIERAGIAQNADTTDFSSGSDWTRPNLGSESEVPSIVEGETARKLTASGGPVSVYQNRGTFTGSKEVVWAVLERGDQARSRVYLRDTSGSTNPVLASYDWERDAVDLVAGDEAGRDIVRERGPNGGRVVLLWAVGSGTAGNNRRGVFEVAEDGDSGIIHAAEMEEQAWPSSLIVGDAAGTARATADIEFEGASISDHLPVVLYARLLKDFEGRGELTEPRIFQAGENDPGGADGALLFASHEADGVRAGYRDAGEQKDATVAQATPAGRSDALEVLLWVRADGSGRLVVMTNQDDTAEAAEWTAPASLEALKNRLSLNATPDGQEKSSGRYMEVKVLRGADFVAQPDGSQDQALIEEAARASVTPEGRFWERPR